jgi:hypothetical protein
LSKSEIAKILDTPDDDPIPKGRAQYMLRLECSKQKLLHYISLFLTSVSLD